MTDINQQKYRLQLLRTMQVALNELSPFFPDFLGHLSIAVARQIHQVHGLIHVIKVDSLGLPRLGRGPGQRLPIQKSVDQGRFSHIGLACEGDLRQFIFRETAGNTADRLQIYIFNNHFVSP